MYSSSHDSVHDLQVPNRWAPSDFGTCLCSQQPSVLYPACRRTSTEWDVPPWSSTTSDNLLFRPPPSPTPVPIPSSEEKPSPRPRWVDQGPVPGASRGGSASVGFSETALRRVGAVDATRTTSWPCSPALCTYSCGGTVLYSAPVTCMPPSSEIQAAVQLWSSKTNGVWGAGWH